jgi:hypothetical protein
MNSRELKNERTGKTATFVPRALPSARPDRTRPSVFEMDVPEAAPRLRRGRDRWSLAIVIVGMCVLGVALFAYVLDPAIATLSDASSTTWSAEGP